MFRDREPIAMRELKDVHCWIKMRCAVLPSKTTTFGLHFITGLQSAYLKFFFLFLNQTIRCWHSKEPSQ